MKNRVDIDHLVINLNCILSNKAKFFRLMHPNAALSDFGINLLKCSVKAYVFAGKQLKTYNFKGEHVTYTKTIALPGYYEKNYGAKYRTIDIYNAILHSSLAADNKLDPTNEHPFFESIKQDLSIEERSDLTDLKSILSSSNFEHEAKIIIAFGMLDKILDDNKKDANSLCYDIKDQLSAQIYKTFLKEDKLEDFYKNYEVTESSQSEIIFSHITSKTKKTFRLEENTAEFYQSTLQSNTEIRQGVELLRTYTEQVMVGDTLLQKIDQLLKRLPDVADLETILSIGAPEKGVMENIKELVNTQKFMDEQEKDLYEQLYRAKAAVDLHEIPASEQEQVGTLISNMLSYQEFSKVLEILLVLDSPIDCAGKDKNVDDEGS